MKRYQVCAIGNAMVDYEIEVEDDFLIDNNVEKGVMTLVDQDRQHVLLGAEGGNIRKKQGGGSAANTMSAFSKLGGKGYYTCKVANDDDGKFYLEELLHDGLDTNLDPSNLPGGITGKCLVMISPDAERTMNTFLGITTDLGVNDISEKAILDSEYIYLEGALISSETGREALKESKEIAEKNGVKVSLTFFDPAMIKYFGDHMKELVGDHIDLIFCNEEEACLFTGETDILEARKKLLKVSDRIAITQGKNGAIVWDGDTFIDIEPYPVKAVDTTGAGDMFAGAFLYGITHGHSFGLEMGSSV
jgi:sugar/nucleoside kinase (ribokinase family)